MRKYAAPVCLLISVVLVIVGLIDRQFLSVMTKAAKVCLECIGIG